MEYLNNNKVAIPTQDVPEESNKSSQTSIQNNN